MEHDTVIPVFTANKGVPKSEEMQNNDSGGLDFYYVPTSPPCRSVMLLARTLGVEMNMKMVDILAGEQMKPEFVKMNPQHTVPTLDDKGFVLWESRAILQYLADRYGRDDTLNPKAAKKAAVVNQRLYFDACTLFPRLRAYIFPVLFRKQPAEPEKFTEFEEALAYLNIYLEDQIWVAGSYMTIADFAIVATICTAQAVGFDMSKYPNINSWYHRAKENMSGFEEMNEKGAQMLGDVFRKNIS